MKKNIFKTLTAAALLLAMLFTLCACASKAPAADTPANVTSDEATMPEPGTQMDEAFGQTPETGKTFTVGICNYVDDASLNQIVENIQTRLGVQ